VASRLRLVPLRVVFLGGPNNFLQLLLLFDWISYTAVKGYE
jgi:hypothetical protein